ncbi:MAG: PQQ-binding-like beta-propeller repeat protein, partial [Planctomycetota bacterium]|nr:PQQ-binding-like beta-propeller repeat protein [Planctomycetota bacterium]
KVAFPFEAYKKHKNNSFASSTPTVDADHVYVQWHSKTESPLMAISHDGKTIWKHDLGPYLHGQGGATSPIVFGDSVFVAHDHAAGSYLLAADRQSGKPRWKIPRDGKRACYATPCVYEVEDRAAEIVFSHCFEGIVGVDAKSGTPNWHIDVFGRASQRALSSPLVIGDAIVATSGGVSGEKQLVVVKPGKNGDVSEAYRIKRQAPHVPTPLAYKDWLFLWSDQGIVSCVNKIDGKVVWQKRVGGNYFCSPICINGRLFCVDVDGTVVVIEAADSFKELARNSLDKPTRSTPAVSGGTLFIRTESHVNSIGGAKGSK